MRSFLVVFLCLWAFLCMTLPCLAFTVTVKEKSFTTNTAETTVTTSSSAPNARVLSTPIQSVITATHKEPIVTQATYALLSFSSTTGTLSPSFSSYTTSYTFYLNGSPSYAYISGQVTSSSIKVSITDTIGSIYQTSVNSGGYFSTNVYVGGGGSFVITTTDSLGYSTYYYFWINSNQDACQANCGLTCGSGTYCSVDYNDLTCQCKLTSGVIAGIVIGSIIGLTLICLCIWACVRRRRSRDVYVAFNQPAAVGTYAAAQPAATYYQQPPVYSQPQQPFQGQYYVAQPAYQPPAVAPQH